MNRKTILAVLLGLAALAEVSGCNTIRGLGQDTQAGGRAVERTANETKEQMEERKRREQQQPQPNFMGQQASPRTH